MPFPHDHPQLAAEIARIYDTAGARIKAALITPPGKSASAHAFNQSRAAQQLHQVKAIITDLKGAAAKWTGKAITTATQTGMTAARAQLKAAGVSKLGTGNVTLSGSFTQIQHDVVTTLARDTVGDLIKAADSMDRGAGHLLRQMSATGVTPGEVNAILAGSHVIEGQPQAAIRELRAALEKVHGKQVTIVGPSGVARTYDASYYADMVATTKTREAVVLSSNETYAAAGIDLVRIVGRNSVHFCTNYLNHVYSLSGKSTQYPALSGLENGGPPFHPNCSKSTSPFVEGLSRITARGSEAAAA